MEKLGNLRTFGNLGNQETLGNLRTFRNLGNQETLRNLGTLLNQGNLVTLGNLGTSGYLGTLQNLVIHMRYHIYRVINKEGGKVNAYYAPKNWNLRSK